jgi:formylglycine-generating enzyme required for sulfatase activity
VRDSAGVSIVENRGDDEPLGAVAVRIRDLVPPDSALTAVPWGVAADPMTGRIYVADWTGTRVATFDRSGVYTGSYGRAGDGPGEFRNPSAVALDPYGALTVWDTGRGILSRWSSEGDLLNEQRPGLAHWGPGFAIGVDWLVTVTSETAPSGMVMEQRLVAQTPRGTETLHEVPLELAMMRMPFVSMPAPKVFAPRVIWTSRGDTVYVLNGPGYGVDLYAHGTPVSSFRRAVNPIQVTDEMAVEGVQSGPGPYRGFMRRYGVTAEEIATAVGHEEVVSPVQGIAVDPRGRLWVTRSSNGVSPELVDILNAGGEYQGTFEAPGVPVAFLSDSLFVSLRLEETGEPTVSLYELRDSAARAASSMAADVTRDPEREVQFGLREFRDCPECPVMVELPPGRFLMGSPDGEEPAALNPDRPEWTERAEKPQIEVEIAYRLAVGKYEVTFAEWDRCVQAGGCTYEPEDKAWGRGDRPVINVSRTDAQQYIEWLSEVTGQRYRLPSEAEWEYAARAGTTSARYWGDELGHGMTVCDGCGSRWENRSTAPVGSFPPNPFGLHDMLGNVEEWVADCWTDTHEGAPADGSARAEDSPWWKDGKCERPVQKGGAWSYYPWTVRSATRSYFWPGPWTDRNDSYGFRVVRSMAPQSPS